MNDTQSKIGKLLQEGEERDAIHIAVLPVVAGNDLTPGAPIGVGEVNGEHYAYSNIFPRRGIVDPFLWDGVTQGERFWMFLTPNTIQDMRHHWKLEGIDVFSPQERAKQWLASFAEENNVSYDELVAGLKAGEVYFGNDTEAPSNAYGQKEALFQHLAILTGRSFSEDHIANTFFRCSC